jgi:hypothetical protein
VATVRRLAIYASNVAFALAGEGKSRQYGWLNDEDRGSR